MSCYANREAPTSRNSHNATLCYFRTFLFKGHGSHSQLIPSPSTHSLQAGRKGSLRLAHYWIWNGGLWAATERITHKTSLADVPP
jgi:hypothetical protein